MKQEKKKNVTIALLGAGWLGEPLAETLLAAGYQIKAATTSSEKAERLAKHGFTSYVLRVETDSITGNFKDFLTADVLILSLPPGGRRNPEVVRDYPAKIRQVIAASKTAGVEHVLFTSSTGVYGDQNGWVNEESPLRPTTASGQALVQVEAELNAAYGDQLTILRLAGLVGGHRQPGRWFAGRKDIAGGEQYVNLVHRIDVMAICEAIIQEGHWGHTLNICADEHPTKAEYYPVAAEQLGLDVPTFKIGETPARGKRVENSRSKLVPGFTYQYQSPFEF